MPAGRLVAGSGRVQWEITCWVGDDRQGPLWRGCVEEAVFEMSGEGTPELDGSEDLGSGRSSQRDAG